MAATKRIKRALVSVYHKDGLDEILKKLHREGVSFVSTGGTQKFIEESLCRRGEERAGRAPEEFFPGERPRRG